MWHLCFVFILISATLGTTVSSNDAKCIRESLDKEDYPNFVCYLSVLVQQNAGKPCDVTVTETIVVPHTSGKNFRRSIYLEDSKMKISGVDTVVHGVPSNHTTTLQGSQYIISVETVLNKSPRTIKISYMIDNGIKNVPDDSRCSNVRVNSSAFTWGFNEWDQTIDELKFRFRSAGSHITADHLETDFSIINSTTIDTTSSNVYGSFFVSSYISDSYHCPINHMCPENQSKGYRIIEVKAENESEESSSRNNIVIFIIIALAALAIFLCCYCIITRRRGSRRKKNAGSWLGDVDGGWEGDDGGGSECGGGGD